LTMMFDEGDYSQSELPTRGGFAQACLKANT
jgi:hypothetical protein